jgi:uncharacterized membrane protein YjjB (DUF3815 family)
MTAFDVLLVIIGTFIGSFIGSCIGNLTGQFMLAWWKRKE